MTQENQPQPRKAPKISRRTFLGGLGAGALALAGCKPGEPSTSTPSTKVDNPVTTVSTVPVSTTEIPTTTLPEKYKLISENSLLYSGSEVGLPEGFGGFQLDIDDGGVDRVGFTDAEVGPKSLFTELMKVIVHQGEGKYGTTPAEVEAYLEQNNYIIPEFYTFKAVGDLQRVPPWVDKVVQPLDLSEPFRIAISEDLLPGSEPEDVTKFFGSNQWEQIAIVNGQLTINIDKDWYGLPDEPGYSSQNVAESLSLVVGGLLEALSRANQANGGKESRPEDLLSQLFSIEMSDAIHDVKVPSLNLDNTVFFYQDDANTVVQHSLFGVVV